MTMPRFTELPDRGALLVTGEDAGKLLQGMITNDLEQLTAPGQALQAGLLSPQGKILFEFFVVCGADGFLLEVARNQSAALARRLGLYKLRAKVDIRDAGTDLVVLAGWGDGASPAGANEFLDPRAPGMGMRAILPAGGPAADWTASPADYHAHRIALGVPEGGKDYDFGDAFPHEANFDLGHGVSFGKGCYVGQEVVARMQHKSVVRKRVVRVRAERELPVERPDVKAGEVTIGRMGSVAGTVGLAMLRLDRAIELTAKGVSITADGIALEVEPAALERYRTASAGTKPL